MQTTSRGYKKPEMTDALEESLPMLQETIDAINTDIDTHLKNESNPHKITANQVLPAQAGKAGYVLGTNGNAAEWVDFEGIKRVISMGGMI